MDVFICSEGGLNMLRPTLALGGMALTCLCSCKSYPVECTADSYLRPPEASPALLNASPDVAGAWPTVPKGDIQEMPTSLVFADATRVTAYWLAFGHAGSAEELTFSEAENKAASVSGSKDVYAMKRWKEGAVQRVRFGFSSPLCTDSAARAEGVICRQYADSGTFLFAVMTCRK
jgi:hypothetical protein